ncbi:hypothetical protein D3C80_996130 [compost metagenome]
MPKVAAQPDVVLDRLSSPLQLELTCTYNLTSASVAPEFQLKGVTPLAKTTVPASFVSVR